MKIKAKYKGQAAIYGYVNGVNYHLIFLCGDVVTISNANGKLTETYVEYTSLKSFLNNWQILS